MNGWPMRCGGMGYHRHGWGGMEQMGGPPMIPAPMACVAMLFGVMIGLAIGRAKAMRHMGMGMGMMGHGDGDWLMRKKMMGKMMRHHHHHHGWGMEECECPESEEERKAGEQQGTEGGA